MKLPKEAGVGKSWQHIPDPNPRPVEYATRGNRDDGDGGMEASANGQVCRPFPEAEVALKSRANDSLEIEGGRTNCHCETPHGGDDDQGPYGQDL